MSRESEYSRINNNIIDYVMPVARVNAFKVVMAVFRTTDGRVGVYAPMTMLDFMAMAGIVKKDTAIKAVKEALCRGFIQRKPAGSNNKFAYSLGSEYTTKEEQ